MAEALQAAPNSLNPADDRDTLVWAHGFFSAVVKSIEQRVPDLISSKTRLKSMDSLLAESRRRLAEIREDPYPDDLDSLERIEKELGGADDAPGPANRKSGPRRGGTAVPLPESDLPM